MGIVRRFGYDAYGFFCSIVSWVKWVI